jgi:hypothetical protein
MNNLRRQPKLPRKGPRPIPIPQSEIDKFLSTGKEIIYVTPEMVAEYEEWKILQYNRKKQSGFRPGNPWPINKEMKNHD